MINCQQCVFSKCCQDSKKIHNVTHISKTAISRLKDEVN
jgi:hypothetical protein